MVLSSSQGQLAPPLYLGGELHPQRAHLLEVLEAHQHRRVACLGDVARVSRVVLLDDWKARGVGVQVDI